IGRVAMPAQYDGVVDPVAVAAAVEQTYADDVLADCIARCTAADDAEFLVAERDGGVIGFLHFDSFGAEPELHRLYVDASVRGGGAGHALVEALRQRLPPGAPYMLLVVAANERAVRFYERHGLRVAEVVDGLAYYRSNMGVEFPPGLPTFPMLVMRRTGALPTTRP
ncbi:MAG TPA: GNAT family N-acetyltransferase, partial [Solirubrobacteraceae bacterium]|nr:GNAT family N-acetyltransferase [Solirubrobacteraceae bacterium]